MLARIGPPLLREARVLQERAGALQYGPYGPLGYSVCLWLARDGRTVRPPQVFHCTGELGRGIAVKALHSIKRTHKVRKRDARALGMLAGNRIAFHVVRRSNTTSAHFSPAGPESVGPMIT